MPSPVKRFLRIPAILHRTVMRSLDHDALNLAQSGAYSAMVSLFPALIVAAAVIAVLPDNAPIRAQLGAFFDRILPPDVLPLMEGYFDPSINHGHSTRAILAALFVSVTGASTVITTFMEGLRRAHDLPFDCWTFWGRRARAFALVPLSLIPLAISSVLVVFGHFIAAWLAMLVGPGAQYPVYLFALILRWVIAFMGSIGLIATLYHMGTPLRQPWRRVLPGAFIATAMWLLTTVAFGWYVTRFANYSQVYGSLGAGIALLFWLYIVCLSVLCGAEFNQQFHLHFHPDLAPIEPPDSNA